jgi:hypothetical protein
LILGTRWMGVLFVSEADRCRRVFWLMWWLRWWCRVSDEGGLMTLLEKRW